MGRDPVEGHRPGEIAAVLVRLGADCLLGSLGNNPAGTEDSAEILAYHCRFAEALGDNVPGTGKGRVGIFHLPGLYEAAGFLAGIAHAYPPHCIGKRLEAEFLGDGGAGAALGTERKIQVLQFGGGHAGIYLTPQLIAQGSGLGNRLQHGFLALFHLREHIYPMLEFRHGGIVHPACLFLAVPADEGNGIPFLEQIRTILHLPGLQAHQGCNMINVDLFHQSSTVIILSSSL